MKLLFLDFLEKQTTIYYSGSFCLDFSIDDRLCISI